MFNTPHTRIIMASAGLVFGLLLIIILQLIFVKDSMMAKLLLDYGETNTLYPFSIQNIMWLIFFLGIAELLSRFIAGYQEYKQLKANYLPEDEEIVLRLKNLPAIYRKIRGKNKKSPEFFLPRLIQRIILQFNNTESVEQTHALLNSSLDLCLHEIDLRYNMLRYIMWLIPTLGFIGTVIGIALALDYAGLHAQDADLLGQLTQRLSMAFYNTLLALLQASVLVFFMNIVQAQEERALNLSGQYCLDNLVNRLVC